MIEIWENLIQLVVTGMWAGISFYRAYLSRSKAWVSLAVFYTLFFAGDLYWLLYLAFYKITPKFSYISELTWYAAYIFLIILVQQVHGRKPGVRPLAAWAGPVFAVGMGIFYMFWGDYLSNILTIVVMGILLYLTLRCIFLGNKNDKYYKDKRYLYITILCICLIEYIMWTLSCFWMGDTLANPYFWADGLLTAAMILLIPATWKAVDA